MDRFLLLCLVASVASFLFPSVTDGSVRVDTTLTMTDGVRLSAFYRLPDGPPPSEGFPAILLVHGFAGSKNTFAWLAEIYADSGYAVVAYSVRGQGRGNAATTSEGVFDWFTGERELEDVREILAWMSGRSDINSERIAIEGASQGGLTCWGAAVARLNIRCAVPVASVPDYSRSMAHNGCNNYFMVAALFNAKNLGLVSMGPFLGDTLYRAYEQDRFNDVLGHLRKRDLNGKIDEVEVPVFATLAWQDDLFGTRSMFDLWGTLNVPKKLLLWPGGHGGPGQKFIDDRTRLTLRFYRRWLRDDTAENVMDADSAVLLTDPSDSTLYAFRSADSLLYAPPNREETAPCRRLYFDGPNVLSDGPPADPFSYSLLYVQNLSNDQRVFRSAPFEKSERIVGAAVSLRMRSEGTMYQANVLLWDYDPATNSRRPLTRGTRQVREGAAQERNITYALEPQFYTIPAGHSVEAHIKFGMPFVKSDDEFGKAAFAPQASALTTFSTDPENPSYLDLLLPGDTPSRVPTVPLNNSRKGELRLIGTPVVVSGRSLGVAVTLPQGTGDARLRIIDLPGRECGDVSVSGSGTFRVETDGLASGVYLLVLLAEGRVTASERFVVRE